MAARRPHEGQRNHARSPPRWQGVQVSETDRDRPPQCNVTCPRKSPRRARWRTSIAGSSSVVERGIINQLASGPVAPVFPLLPAGPAAFNSAIRAAIGG